MVMRTTLDGGDETRNYEVDNRVDRDLNREPSLDRRVRRQSPELLRLRSLRIGFRPFRGRR